MKRTLPTHCEERITKWHSFCSLGVSFMAGQHIRTGAASCLSTVSRDIAAFIFSLAVEKPRHCKTADLISPKYRADGQAIAKLIAQGGNPQQLAALLATMNTKALYNVSSTDMSTALLTAVRHGNCPVVNYLCEVFPNMTNTDHGSGLALRTAVLTGQMDSLVCLLAHGAKVNLFWDAWGERFQPNTRGTALDAALNLCRVDIAHVLIESGGVVVLKHNMMRF